MIWAAICAKGKSYIAWLNTRMNSNMYTVMQERELIDLRDGSLMFQQDNVSVHSSATTKQWLEEKDIDVLPWPVLRSDLNPMENLWGIHERRVY